jgi:HD-like signal output (HDOD) protein
MPVQDYVERLKDLPIMPEVAAKVVAASGGGLDMSFKDLESIIKVDPGLTAKILKIANSALYARQREIKSLQTAITLLGFKNIKNLVLLVSASRMFPRLRASAFHSTYWKRSILSAFLSKSLAVRCGRGDAAEELFLCGLLHDIGQAVLFNGSPEEYEQVLEAEKLGAMLLETIELQVLGVDHRVIGGEVLSRWNFPALYVDTALEHESLNVASSHKALVILVSVAGILAELIGAGTLAEPRRELFQKLAPYTCVDASVIDSPMDSWNAELRKDPLFQEYHELFGIS